MNDNKLSREDKQLEYLYCILSYTQKYTHDFGRATRLSQLVEHKEQVKDLVSEITHTLREFSHWSSGRNLLLQILEIKNKLQCYYDKVFITFRNEPERVIRLFNQEKDNFEVLLEEIYQLYR